jgi:hypothetical protein
MVNFLANLFGGTPQTQAPASPPAAPESAPPSPPQEESSNPLGFLGGIFNAIGQHPWMLFLVAGAAMVFEPVRDMLGGLLNNVMGMFGGGSEDNNTPDQAPATTQPNQSPAQNSQPQQGNILTQLIGMLGGLGDTAREATASAQSLVKEGYERLTKPDITHDDSKPNTAILNDSGQLVAGNNPTAKVDPASTTKTMTALTICEMMERGELPKDFIERNDGLFRRMLSNSDNDASTRLAEIADKEAGGPGTEASFAQRMNQLGKEIGLKGSNFKNAHGLPENGHFSTAEDMARWMWTFEQRYPDISQKYSAIENVATAGRFASNVGDAGCETFKTGTAGGLYGRTTAQGTRSGAGTTHDGGAAAIAECNPDQYVGGLEALFKQAQGLSHTILASAEEVTGSSPVVPSTEMNARTQQQAGARAQ